MRSGMTQIFTLEINLSATKGFGQAFGKIEGSGTTNKILEAGLKFLLKLLCFYLLLLILNLLFLT